MRPIKNLFNSASAFLDNQERLDQFATGATGFMSGAGIAYAIGYAAAHPMLMLVGFVAFQATPVLTLPFLGAALEKFRPKTFAASAAFSLAMAFGLSAALPVPTAWNAPVTAAQEPSEHKKSPPALCRPVRPASSRPRSEHWRL